MKKTTISVSCDEEKLSALKLYLDGKDTSVESALEKALDTLYTKYVPLKVRSYFEMRSGLPAESTPHNQRKRKPEAVEGQTQIVSTHDMGKDVQS